MGKAKARNQNSPINPRKSSQSTSDTLLRELELLLEHYSSDAARPPLSPALQTLEAQSLRDARELGPVTEEKEAIGKLADELRMINDILEKHEYNKSSLIQILLDVQAQLRWLPKPALRWISERLDIPLGQIYNIVTFYKAFSLVPLGRNIVQVCLGTSCHVRGGSRRLDSIEQILDIKAGETTADQEFTLQTVNCLGCCALAPVMVVNDKVYGNVRMDGIKNILDSVRGKSK